MDRKLLDHLPPVLREILEFQAINGAVEPEISRAWDALARVMENQFLDTADSTGLAVWERELKLYPKDTDSLEVRRARIKAAWNVELPYTLPWLKKWLTNLCGPEGHEETLDGYTLDILLDYSALPDASTFAEEILDMLLTARPATLRILMTALVQSQGTVSCGAFVESSYSMELWPSLAIDVESVGGTRTAGHLERSIHYDIYPVGG